VCGGRWGGARHGDQHSDGMESACDTSGYELNMESKRGPLMMSVNSEDTPKSARGGGCSALGGGFFDTSRRYVSTTVSPTAILRSTQMAAHDNTHARR
jgi:hypothetical protein